MDETSPQLPSLLVFADDWNRHPSSSQHLVRQLLGRYAVYWVNTIGLRKPRFDLATVSRGFEKLRGWMRGDTRCPNGLTAPQVLNPRMWPWFSTAFDRKLNRLLLTKQLRKVIASLPDPPIVISTLPIVEGLMGVLPVRSWVYYCVDDFTEWAGCDHQSLREMEERLVRQADVLIAVSEVLQDKLARLGRKAHLLTHGVDLGFWAVGADDKNGTLPECDGVQRPLVVFWGLIDRRMDVDFVKRLAADLVSGTIVLAGPELDPDPALYDAGRVVHLPALPYERLPRLARQADVLIMPYADLPVTRAIQPLKLKEYLATGKPAVVRDLPAMRTWSDCLDLAATAEEFSRAVRRRLAAGLPEEQRLARARLSQESWTEKARLFEQLALQTQSTIPAVAGP